MALTVTRVSGSGGHTDDEDIAVPVDDGNDLLVECSGGCGKKILSFGFPESSDWGDSTEGALCLECRALPLKHTPVGES